MFQVYKNIKDVRMCSFSCLLCGKFGQSLTPKAQQKCERTAEAMTQPNQM